MQADGNARPGTLPNVPGTGGTVNVLGCTLDLGDCPDAFRPYVLEDWAFTDHGREASGRVIVLGPTNGAPKALPDAARAVTVHAMQQQIPLGVHEDAVTYAPRGEVLLRADYLPGTVTVGLAPSAVPDRATLAALKVMIAEGVRRSGLLPLHAAVAARGDTTCAFIGPSGTGKSTTLLRALQAGWTALAEDFVWLDPATAQVYGWDRGMRLLQDSLAHLPPNLRQREWARHADGKAWLPFEALVDADVAFDPHGRTLTQVAVLSRRPEDPSEWLSMPRLEAVRAFWEAAGLPVTDAAASGTASQISRVLPRLKFSRLVLGRGPLPL
ncbi:hypothetical protein [Deinococcus aquiradiocola]|uniref:Serine kinase n=1 Tax=Deinococcus aquiradiocola TaxID=393059 RepID=A0A917UQL8_9DEIO|nr:hypothetical protein [Deinococcus aquiradiocola]GGJ75776.1 hypothetical protein GCM10008939_20030 [Deinococcus aquiradiocola]